MKRLAVAALAVIASCAWIVHELDATEPAQPVARVWTMPSPTMPAAPSRAEPRPAVMHDPPRYAPPTQPGLSREMQLQPGGTHGAPLPGE